MSTRCPRCRVRCTTSDLAGEEVVYDKSKAIYDGEDLKQVADGTLTYDDIDPISFAKREKRTTVCPACVQEEAFGVGNTTLYRDTYKGKVLDSGFGKRWRRGR